MDESTEKEITKEKFKELFFKYNYCDESYWNTFFENEKDKKYFFTEPNEPNQNRMMIISGENDRRIILMSEESEESFFDYPGKD